MRGERRVFRSLSSVDQVRSEIWARLRGFERRIEEIPLAEALGRVLAEDVVSPVDIPGFDRATKDGYAVRAEDTFGADQENPVSLRILGVA